MKFSETMSYDIEYQNEVKENNFNDTKSAISQKGLSIENKRKGQKNVSKEYSNASFVITRIFFSCVGRVY